MFILFLIITGCNTKVVYNQTKLPSIVDEQALFNDFKTLASDEFLGRKIGEKGGRKASNYLVAKLFKYDVLPFNGQFKHNFSFSQLNTVIQGQNIVGVVPGSRFPNKYIVITAHYDHIGVKNNLIFNGADDNASGTSALLAFAKVLTKSPLKHSVILLFTDGEESNLRGSKAFIKQQHGMVKDFKLNVNLDMLSGVKRTKKLRFISRRLNTLLTDAQLNSFKSKQFEEVQLVQGFKTIRRIGLNDRINWAMASDHWTFHQHNIPFIYYGVGTHHNYHKETDTFENSNLSFFYNATNAIYQKILILDSQI